MQYHRIRDCIAVLVCSGLFLLSLFHSHFSEKTLKLESLAYILSDFDIHVNNDQNHRSLRGGAYLDPKTVTLRQPMDAVFMDPHHDIVSITQDESSFVVPDTSLSDSKHAEPSVVRNRLSPRGYSGLVVDVLSIGSKMRPELVECALRLAFPTLTFLYFHISYYDLNYILFSHIPFLFSAHCTIGDLGVPR